MFGKIYLDAIIRGRNIKDLFFNILISIRVQNDAGAKRKIN